MIKLPSIHLLIAGTIKETIYIIIGDHLVTMATQMLQVEGEKCLKKYVFWACGLLQVFWQFLAVRHYL